MTYCTLGTCSESCNQRNSSLGGGVGLGSYLVGTETRVYGFDDGNKGNCQRIKGRGTLGPLHMGTIMRRDAESE